MWPALFAERKLRLAMQHVRLQRVRLEIASLSKLGASVVHRVLRVCYAFHDHFGCSVSCCSQLFPFFGCLAMDRHSSSVSTVPSLDDDFERDTWNLFLEQVSGIFASHLVDIDLARIALSCLFAIDLLCYKEDVFDSAR